MIINLDEVMKSFDGTPVQKMGKHGMSDGNLRIRELFIDILLKNHPSEEKLNGTEKIHRFEIARKIYHSQSEYKISFDEMSIIRQAMLDKNFPVIVVGTITEIFDGGGKDAN